MQHGTIVHTDYTQTPILTTDVCVMRISQTAKELFVKFPDGTEKQLTGGGSGGIFTASNGLTKVSTDVKLGGTITADTTINVGAFKINYTGTVIHSGVSGANKITGAGTFFEWIPNQQTIVAAKSVNSTLSTINGFGCLLMGQDNQLTGAMINIFSFGSDNSLIATAANSIIGGSNLALGNNSSDTINQSIVIADATDSDGIDSCIIMGTGNSLLYSGTGTGNNYSFITGTSIETNGVNHCVIIGDSIDSSASEDAFSNSLVVGSFLTINSGGNSNNNIISGGLLTISTTFENSIVTGDSNTVSDGSLINSAIFGNQNTFGVGAYSNESLIVTGLQNNILGSRTSIISTFDSDVTDVSQSIIIGNQSSVTYTNLINCIVSGEQNSDENSINNFISGKQNFSANNEACIISGSNNSLSQLHNSLIVCGGPVNGISIGSIGDIQTIAALAIGSAPAITYFNSTLVIQDYTLYTEQISLVKPGGGIKLVSPDGLVTKTLTIDNAGLPVWS